MDSTNEYYRMLNALSKIYISIYTFDLKKDIEYPFKSNEYIDMWSKNVEGAQNKTYNTMKNLTEEKHVDMMLEFVNLSTLDERMKGKSDIAIVFKGKINGWCRARFIAKKLLCYILKVLVVLARLPVTAPLKAMLRKQLVA